MTRRAASLTDLRRRAAVATPDLPPSRKASEAVRCRWWREHVVALSRPQLAERLGLTVSEIANYEAGVRRQTGRAPDYRRYRLLCAALDAGLEGFDWVGRARRGGKPNAR